MGLFGKKKDKDISLEEAAGEKSEDGADQDSSVDESQDSKIDDNASQDNSKSGFKFKNMSLLISDVERLKAQAEANTDVRRMFDEKFNRINEEIGELRSMLISQEKQVTDIEVKATKAADLVESVQPQQLYSEVKREDVKIETANAKIESVVLMMEKFKEELSSMKREVQKFKGLKETLTLNDDLKKEINDIKKALAIADKDANQVEDIFVQVQKNYNEFMKYKTLINQTQELLQATRKEFDNLKVKTEEFLPKKEFEDSLKDIKNTANSLKDKEKEMDDLEKDLKKVSQISKNTKLASFIIDTNNKTERLEQKYIEISDQFKGMSRLFEANLKDINHLNTGYLAKKSNSELDESARRLNEQIEKIEQLAEKMLKVNIMLAKRAKY